MKDPAQAADYYERGVDRYAELGFHNNAIATIEAAVGFYDGEAFNNSPSGKFLVSTDPNGVAPAYSSS